MRPTLAIACLCVPVLLAAALPCAAEERPCADQIEDLCSDTEPNTPQRRACVRENLDELSPECRKRLGHRLSPQEAGALKRLADACGPDREKMAKRCPNRAGGRMLECLRAHRSEFSESCQKLIGQSTTPPAQPEAKPSAQDE